MTDQPDTYFGRKRSMVENALARMNGVASKVLHVLELKQDNRTGEVAFSVAGMAPLVGSDRRDVARACAELVKLGVAEEIEAGGGWGKGKKFRLLTVPRGLGETPLLDLLDAGDEEKEIQGANPPEDAPQLQGAHPSLTGGSPPTTGGSSLRYRGISPPPNSALLLNAHTQGERTLAEARAAGFRSSTARADSPPRPRRRPPPPNGFFGKKKKKKSTCAPARFTPSRPRN